MTEDLNAPKAKEIAEAIKKQLETDQDMIAWFGKYGKHSWDSFINRYASSKALALRFPTLYIDKFKPANKHYNKLARIALEAIQQKKFFNLQCEWRAGKVELPFITYGVDFEIIGRDSIMDYPYLSPVSKEEMELFIQFLNSDMAEEYGENCYIDWQDYDSFSNNSTVTYKSKVPNWYEYYDSIYGTGYLSNFPDDRGEQEDEYIKVAFEQERRGRPPHIMDPEFQKPFPDSKAEWDFAKCFETPEMAEVIVSHLKSIEHHDIYYALDKDYEFLKSLPDTPTLIHHSDWRVAIQLTVERYRLDKIAEALPRVWRQYIKDVGDDPEAYVHRRMANTKFNIDELDKHGHRKAVSERVKRGRKLMGESESE